MQPTLLESQRIDKQLQKPKNNIQNRESMQMISHRQFDLLFSHLRCEHGLLHH